MNGSDLLALRRLADQEAIRECVHRYARGIDRHDEELLRSVFHADAVDNHGDVVLGRDEFASWVNDWHTRVAAHHMHAITTHFADVERDEAHAVTYVLFTLCRRDGKTVHVGGGRYIDRLLRRGNEWRIILRRLVIDWRMNAGPLTRRNLLNDYPHGTCDLADPSYEYLISRSE